MSIRPARATHSAEPHLIFQLHARGRSSARHHTAPSSAGAVLHFHTLPPAAATMASARQSTEPFCIACFRLGPRRSESARLASDTDAAHSVRALLCWTLLTQPLLAPRRWPCCSLRLWAYDCFLAPRALPAFIFNGTRRIGRSVRNYFWATSLSCPSDRADAGRVAMSLRPVESQTPSRALVLRTLPR